MLASFCLRLALGMAASLFLLPASQVSHRYYRTHFLTILGLSAASLVDLRSSGMLILGILGTAMLLAFRPREAESVTGPPAALVLADSFTSAALLGATLSAMLLGHLYLIAPSMSVTPLFRLLSAMFVASGLRLVYAGVEFGLSEKLLTTDDLLFLPVRWGIGLGGPLILGWMAWQATRIRSTQSATGILYVAVIFCFIGELMGLSLH